MTLDADRVAGLAKTKLEGLVRRAFPQIVGEAETFNAGVGLAHDDLAFVYIIDDSPSPLAAALAWGKRRRASQLHVIVDRPDPLLAVMAAGLHPSPLLWQAVGAELQAMDAPALAPRPTPSDAVLAQRGLLEAAGCDVVLEHGVMIGEILGLEVARVVVEPDGRTLVRVGVGLYDQEAHALMHADSSVDERLDHVIAEVRRHRRRGAGPHPLNRVARQRWLRSLAVAEPALVGVDVLELVEPLAPRGGIREDEPVAARGHIGDATVLAVFSTGIDLDIVPVAAGHVGVDTPDRVLLVLPERDHHDIVMKMAAHLRAPAAFAAMGDPWSS